MTVMAQDRGEKPAYASRQADTASVQINIKEVRFPVINPVGPHA